jgi:hypothetical protein
MKVFREKNSPTAAGGNKIAMRHKITSEPLTIVDELLVVEIVKGGSIVVVQEEDSGGVLNAP